MSSRYVALDGWRGLSIMAVLFGHFVTTRYINAGRVGVELFFALSGLLIGGVLFRGAAPLDVFAVKRISRIVPSMWLFLVVAVVVAWFRGESGAVTVLPSVLGLADVSPSTIDRVRHLWSVSVELKGYVALGVIAWLSRRYCIPAHWMILAVLAASWIHVILLHAQQADEYYSTYWRFENRLTAMFLGAALASSDWRAPKVTHGWWILLLAGVFLQVNVVPDVLKYTLGSALVALACWQLSASTVVSGLLTHRVFVSFGVASYSIYLWQQLFYLEKVSLGAPLALMFAVLMGFVAHYLWDHRVHQWVQRILLDKLSSRSRYIKT